MALYLNTISLYILMGCDTSPCMHCIEIKKFLNLHQITREIDACLKLSSRETKLEGLVDFICMIQYIMAHGNRKVHISTLCLEHDT